jgi:hypothetical protein
MKIILTNAEACAIVASRHSVGAHQVEIEPKPFALPQQLAPVTENGIGCEVVRGALISLFDEGVNIGRCGPRNKIALIKAIRTLTDCSLKDGKDFVEQSLLNEHCHF